MGKLGRGIGRVLEKAADIPFRWRKIDDFVRTRNLDLLTDTRRLRGIAELSEHIGTVAKRAGPVEAVFLLKHVERGTDAAELARVSKVAGKRRAKQSSCSAWPRRLEPSDDCQTCS